MQTIKWDESLTVGSAGIDAQHQYLFNLANELVTSLESGSANLQSHEALKALEAYVREHFRDEEAVIATCNPDGLEAHQQKHARLHMDVENLRGQLIAGMPDVGVHVVKWVEHCLIPHIQGADMQALKGVQQS